ncbi:hypothetical protein Sjap_003915 [Stephania japonica]|uniref:BZIP domain-containing protein n=1 Tax=Stephania japonica TaxID=461633 RepID=A0AAP0KSB6_9MAGN
MMNGLDLNVQTGSYTTPTQDRPMHQLYESHEEEPKPLNFYMPCLNLGIQGEEEQYESSGIVSNIAKHESSSIVSEDHGMWGSSHSVMDYGSHRSGMEDSQFVTGEGSNSGQFGSIGEAVSHAGVVSGEATMYQQYPCFRVGIANEGSNGIQIYENTIDAAGMRRRRRMIKNRESAARSRARKQAYNAQLQVEIKDLTRENEILNTALKALFFDAGGKSESGPSWLQRSFSGPL